MNEVKKRRVVTCFLEYEGRILILKRSGKVGTYRGRWGAVAGYIEEGESPDEAARKEIEEEVGIKGAKLVKRGEPFEFLDPEVKTLWVVHPYRFAVDTDRIRIDWEHVESKWIPPEELESHETVPKLGESWRRVSGR
jgi:8-oxo-dGTP pyrophosphatase MutT (NUDIX family)